MDEQQKCQFSTKVYRLWNNTMKYAVRTLFILLATLFIAVAAIDSLALARTDIDYGDEAEDGYDDSMSGWAASFGHSPTLLMTMTMSKMQSNIKKRYQFFLRSQAILCDAVGPFENAVGDLDGRHSNRVLQFIKRVFIDIALVVFNIFRACPPQQHCNATRIAVWRAVH